MKNSFPTCSSGPTSKKSKVIASPEEMIALGIEIGRALRPQDVVTLRGDLGAGKTTLAKGIVAAFSGVGIDEVTSPTFVYCNLYEGKGAIYHFDLYRLKSVSEFVAMGFDEMVETKACCIEWPERISSWLPNSTIEIELEYVSPTKRHVFCPTLF